MIILLPVISALLVLAQLTPPSAPHAPGCLCRLGLTALHQEPANGTRLNQPDNRPVAGDSREVHLSNLRQLTFGGQNAEAYWNLDGTKITYQTKQPQFPDEQIFTMNADGSNKTLISTGKGRCTCSYFTPDSAAVYFSSTHELNEGAQVPIDMSEGYIWKVNPQFALYRRTLSTNQLDRILRKDGYIAETTIAPNGTYMTFTGLFEGDLEIYRANLDGTNIQRLTSEFGYDGGPFVSWDSQSIVYRRDNLQTQAQRDDYSRLLLQNKVRPGDLDLWIMNADGTNKRQVTALPGASFAPFLHPDNRQIIFSSNFHDPSGREFDLFVVNVDGTGLRQITFTPEFDGFPMFSRDGKKLIWASNRYGLERGETNIFVADWTDTPAVTETKAEANHDVWVYSFASVQDTDPFLRAWGTGAATAEFDPQGEDSVSLVSFALPEASGDVLSATLTLRHIKNDTARTNMRRYPILLHLIPAGFDEKTWDLSKAGPYWPKGDPIATGRPGFIYADGSFDLNFDLLSVNREVIEAIKSGQVAFAISSRLPASELGREAIYKLHSRNTPDAALRPTLTVSRSRD